MASRHEQHKKKDVFSAPCLGRHIFCGPALWPCQPDFICQQKYLFFSGFSSVNYGGHFFCHRADELLICRLSGRGLGGFLGGRRRHNNKVSPVGVDPTPVVCSQSACQREIFSRRDPNHSDWSFSARQERILQCCVCVFRAAINGSAQNSPAELRQLL